jgi:hypothetical protein
MPLTLSLATILLYSYLIGVFFLGYESGKMIYQKFNDSEITNMTYIEVPFLPANFSFAICKTKNFDRTQVKNNSLKQLAENIFEITPTGLLTVEFNEKVKDLNLSDNAIYFKYLNNSDSLEQCY